VHELWEATPGSEASFIHLRYGPFCTVEALAETIRDLSGRRDQPFWTVRPRTSGRAEGWLSLCDVYPADATIEIGSIWFSPRLRRTRAATEAVFLLMRHVFDDLGYKRLVWRCQALNAASLSAAKRYGFVAEGIWRRAVIIKGEQRDIAWHSMLDSEWPTHRRALLSWLSDANFRSNETAIASLAEIPMRGTG
jgi:RimJ/RimL family protein N-acetyltransferase